MDPTLVVGALVAGASVAGQAAVEESVKDAYGALKRAVLHRVAHEERADEACREIEGAAPRAEPAPPEATRTLEEELRSSGAETDDDLRARVEELEELLRHGARHGATHIDARWSRAATIGFDNTVHHHYGPSADA